MKFISLIFIIVTAFASSCQNKSVDPNLVSAEGDLIGSWRLYERGYSPGAGYIIDPVPSEPARWVAFNVNGTFQSNLTELGRYNYYRVVNDAVNSSKIVALFESEPANVDPANLDHSYQASFENGGLRLSFRYCFEGCHMAFHRITPSGE